MSPIPEGGDARDALANTIDLARHAEQWGYHRFWLAEHHNMPGIASSATSVMIGQVAAATSRIRVGSGGVMLPNHAPLVVAEQFGTLATLFPQRIDLGLGRAPGTDGLTMRALRRHLDGGDDFPRDVIELLAYFAPHNAQARVRAIPGEGTDVPIWILGSSLYGAQLAAHFGLPYAFASHFAPGALDIAFETYRAGFRPSEYLEKPRAMLAINVFAAESADEAALLMTSVQQAFANLRSGKPGPLPKPRAGFVDTLPAHLRESVEDALSVAAIGTPEIVQHQLAALIDRHKPDEVILAGQIHDHAARLKSFEIAARAMGSLA